MSTFITVDSLTTLGEVAKKLLEENTVATTRTLYTPDVL